MKLPPYVKPSFLAVKDAELRFLDSLPPSKQRDLVGHSSFDRAKWHIRQYGDIGFTIAGVKPCALLAHPFATWYAKELVEAALLPLMEPEGALAKAGFELHEIEHGFRTSDPAHRGFRGGWVLVNTQHPEYPLVRDTFLTPQDEPVPEEQIGEALGYPTLSGDGIMYYMDATETEEKGVCCVPVCGYLCSRDGDIEELDEVIEHYYTYSEVWAKLGRLLTIDCREHPRLKAHIEKIQAEEGQGSG